MTVFRHLQKQPFGVLGKEIEEKFSIHFAGFFKIIFLI
jgi:hypothetical protein